MKTPAFKNFCALNEIKIKLIESQREIQKAHMRREIDIDVYQSINDSLENSITLTMEKMDSVRGTVIGECRHGRG